MEHGHSSWFRLLAGYLSAFGATATSALSCSCVQLLQGTIPDFQLSVIRSIVQVLLYTSGAIVIGAKLNINTGNIPALFYLGVAYMAVNVGVFGAAAYLPLSESQGIVTIGLIVTAFLHSKLVIKKDINKSNMLSFLVCVIGVTLAVQPSWLFKQKALCQDMTFLPSQNMSQEFYHTHKCSAHSSSSSKSQLVLGYILSFIGGAGLGVIFDISGVMLQGVKPVVKAIYAAMFSGISSAVFMFYMEDPVLIMDITQFMLALGHAVFSGIASFLSIQAGHFVQGPSVSVVYSFEVVTMLIAQYTIMHSVMPGNYNWIEVAGCVIIALGASIPSTLDILAHRANADELP